MQLAVDIGGTFTDVVLRRPDGRTVSHKLLTTHADPGEAFLAGVATVLDRSQVEPEQIDLVLHGTTLATNALIERRGAATALVTTEGHRDALALAYEDRFEQYDINIDRPRPLVPRYLRLPVAERVLADGRVARPLDPASVDRLLPVLDEQQVESVAVGLLHSYINPTHEEAVGEQLARARPELSITLSSEVCPEIREYDRFSTACANAYVRPLVDRYLRRLETELRRRGVNCPFLLMTSGGGLTTVETACRFPIRLVESGPAGGAILAARVARSLDHEKVLSFDMGGTTAKLCLIDGGEPKVSRSFEVDRTYRFRKGSGLPLRIPVIDMVEIGAGGGSIAEVDRLERLRVGPRSAGSEPGPAAYGRGGEQPTVTDADVMLGRIPKERFAGGDLALDSAAAASALERSVGARLAVAPRDAAAGVVDVVEENMAAAARAHAAEAGLDLSQRVMIAFGGAAPLHAAGVARRLGVERIIVPTGAGVGSAVGFLLAPARFEVVRSRPMNLAALDPPLLNALFAEMKEEAEAVLRAAVGDEPLRETRQAYMRYQGQGHEIAVDLPTGSFDRSAAQVLRDAFEATYQTLYGQIIAEVPVELLSLTLSLAGSEPPFNPATANAAEAAPGPARADWDSSLPCYLRENLASGFSVSGPALVSEAQTTTFVPDEFTLRVDPGLNLVLDRNR
ncbi:MAG: hydantoinase/oxoprolinase family protein [Pseudomonadota bacterium]